MMKGDARVGTINGLNDTKCEVRIAKWTRSDLHHAELLFFHLGYRMHMI